LILYQTPDLFKVTEFATYGTGRWSSREAILDKTHREIPNALRHNAVFFAESLKKVLIFF